MREVNRTYGSKDFLVLTYTPVSSFIEKETILNLQLLKSKIEKLSWVDSVVTVIDVPLLKSTDEGLMERLKNYKTLAYPEIDRKRGFDEITVTFQPSNPNRPIIIITEVAHPSNGITTHFRFLKINHKVNMIKIKTPIPKTTISLLI